jgi:glycosyltransferase involved in cell wall biosynthesis
LKCLLIEKNLIEADSCVNIVVLHHHLNTGGVTKVIHTQLDAYAQVNIQARLIVGDDSGEKPDAIVPEVWPELNYLDDTLNQQQRSEHFDALRQCFEHHLDIKHDLLHIHNLNLGKNPLLNLVVHEWCRRGGKVLNHCHDFAEDGRQKNMNHLKLVIEQEFESSLEAIMYPKDCLMRYAVINGVDRQRLLAHGVEDHHILDCPNAISDVPEFNAIESRERICNKLNLNPEKKIFTYPVRVIRRKNIGELIMLAVLFEQDAQFLVTQPPQNPEEIEHYQPWLTFCEEHQISVVFEAGNKTNFLDLMAGTDAVVTTSIQEGFGMVFLEPWLWKKPVFGRDLKDVTTTFKDKGLDLSSLYQTFKVDGQHFETLTSEQQQQFILKAKSNAQFRKDTMDQNKLDLSSTWPTSELLSQQREHVLEHYSISAYGHSLADFYATSFQ